MKAHIGSDADQGLVHSVATTAANAHDITQAHALLQIGQRAPDLLITNLELPGMDGLAMLRTLERCESIAGMRILALSHQGEDELMQRGGLPASVELMQQPVSPEGVAVRVGRWLLHQRAS